MVFQRLLVRCSLSVTAEAKISPVTVRSSILHLGVMRTQHERLSELRDEDMFSRLEKACIERP